MQPLRPGGASTHSTGPHFAAPRRDPPRAREPPASPRFFSTLACSHGSVLAAPTAPVFFPAPLLQKPPVRSQITCPGEVRQASPAAEERMASRVNYNSHEALTLRRRVGVQTWCGIPLAEPALSRES